MKDKEEHSKQITELKQEIDRLNTDYKLQITNNEREISRLKTENEFIKTENAKKHNDDDKNKEYRDRCIILEKSFTESELKIALKDIELSQMKNEIDKFKGEIQKLEKIEKLYEPIKKEVPRPQLKQGIINCLIAKLIIYYIILSSYRT